MFRFLLTTTLLAGALGVATPSVAGDHGDREWRHKPRHERSEWHDQNKLRRVERHSNRGTRRALHRAERHGEHRALREWRWEHRAAGHHGSWRQPPHAHLHPRPIRHGYGHSYRWHAAPTPRDHHDRVTYRHDGVDPLPIIGGGVIGGVLGNELGNGDPAAATAGLFIGSMVGYELGRH